MNLIRLTDKHSRATAAILPEAGFNLFQLRIPVAGIVVDVLDAEPGFESTGANPTHGGIPLLFPFPNRIRAGRYQWAGREYTLEGVHRDAWGNAIHGLVFDRPWRVVAQGDNFIVGRFQLSVDARERRSVWPADFVLDVRYELRDDRLRCDLRVHNPDRVALPWGFGTHPYFRIPLQAGGAAGQCLVQAQADRAWELVDCLPTGRRLPVSGPNDLREGRELEGLKLDDVLTGLATEGGVVQSVVMDPAAGLVVTQTADEVFEDLVVYTPPHGRAVCVEPYTCVTDAINLAAKRITGGWQVLEPGADYRTWFEIRASLIYA
ncbi:MAG: aldose 1-epimerase [Planctomycetaceae bacterium]